MARVGIAIDLSSAVSGGGLTYARSLLPYLREDERTEVRSLLVRNRIVAEEIAGLFPAARIRVAEHRVDFLSVGWLGDLSAVDADVVFAPTEVGWSPPRTPLVLAGRNVKIFAEKPTSLKPIVRRAAARRTLRRADTVIFPSQYVMGIAVSRGLVIEDQAQVIYHGGPPPTALVQPRDPSLLLMVSDLYPHKRIELAIRSLPLLPHMSLAIAGGIVDNHYERFLGSLAHRIGVENRVEFLGRLGRQPLSDLYARSHALLWLSEFESFGNPLVEAMAHGTPIIATRGGATAELCGDYARYVAPEPREIASTLTRLDTGPQAPPPRKYSWELCARRTSDVLIRAVRDRG